MGLGNANLEGGRFYLCCGWKLAVRKFRRRPAGNGGIWLVLEMESMHEVEKKIKAAVYLKKAKVKSDIWKQFSTITEKIGKS